MNLENLIVFIVSFGVSFVAGLIVGKIFRKRKEK